MKTKNPIAASIAALACCGAALHAVPVEIVSETFDNPSGDAPLSTYGWSVLLTEDGLISDYGTQSRAAGVGSGDYAFYAPKADDNAPWTALVPNDPALVSTTVPAGFDIADFISVAWDSSADNVDHAYRVAVQIGGVWYASSQTFNDLFPDSGTTPENFVSLLFNPVSFANAANWLTVENTTLDATAPLSLGAAPGSDLSGDVTAVGFYLVAGVDDEVAGDHVRFDNVTVIADGPAAPEQVYLQSFDYADSTSLSDYGWTAWVTEYGSISNYTSTYTNQQRVIGVTNASYAYYAPKQDDSTLDAVPNAPAMATTTAPGPINIADLGSVRWLASGDNADHEYRVAIQVGGVWYASEPALNDGIPDSSTTYTPLIFEPGSFATASNWLTIQNMTLGSPGQLSLGSAPGSDLTGMVTAFGLYMVSGTDDEIAGDHVRFDDFEIRALLPTGQVAPRITSFTSVGGGVWELTLEGAAATGYEFYSSTDLTFAPGTLVTSLTQNNPAEDPGDVTGGNLLTTDANGDGKVRLTLSGATRDFVRAQSAP